MTKAVHPRPIVLTTTAANQLNDAALAKITINGAVRNWLDVPPTLTPGQAQTWGIVLANLSAFCLRVIVAAYGEKWIPPWTADRFQGCESCSLIITIVDLNPPTGTVTHTGSLLISYALEPDTFDNEAYPHTLV